MKIELINFLTPGGSLNFMDVPGEIIGGDDLYEYLGTLDGVEMKGATADFTEVWMDFSFRGYDFAINTQLGDYWFFAENPDCPQEILLEIAAHCQKLLEK